jgi:hypothetical protein
MKSKNMSANLGFWILDNGIDSTLKVRSLKMSGFGIEELISS